MKNKIFNPLYAVRALFAGRPGNAMTVAQSEAYDKSFPNNIYLTSVNSAGTADVNMIKVNAANVVELGTEVTAPRFNGAASLSDVLYTDTFWDDLFFPLNQSKLGVLDKPDYDYTLQALMFPQNDTGEYVQITGQLNHKWKTGTVIYPHVHWKQRAAQIPVFKISYKWYNKGEAIPADPSNYTMDTLVFPYTSGSIHPVSHSAAGISGAGKDISSIPEVQLYRDDNVLTSDTAALQFDIHIEIDSPGSHSAFVK